MRQQVPGLQIQTAAVNLPVSLNEIKSRLDIPDSDVTQDPNLMGSIRAATLACEQFTRRTFVNATWTLFLDRFPGKKLPWWDGVREGADTELTDLTEPIMVPLPPLSSVTFVKAHHQDGTTTTVVATDYIVDTAREPGRIVLKIGKSWPTSALRAINGVEVEFVAGYGPVGSDVPADIREAIMISIAELHSSESGEIAKKEKVGESEIERFSAEQIPASARNLLTVGSRKIWRV